MPAPAFEHIGNRADGWGPIAGRDAGDDRRRRDAGKKEKVCSGLHSWKLQLQKKKGRLEIEERIVSAVTWDVL